MLVGVTGAIGAGKSTFARALEALGARRVDADAVAHQVLELPAVKEKLRRSFGSAVLAADGTVDRAVLGPLVFAEDKARQRLEEIVRPFIEAQIRRETADHEGRVVVLDAPLIFEWGLQERYDCVVVVDAPEEIRLQRLAERAGWSAAEARRRQAAQLSAAEKRRRADLVVENEGDPAALLAKARKVAATWGLPPRGSTGPTHGKSI